MDPSRWRQIEQLYHAVLECEPAIRVAFLARADPELRREVESLLAQGSGASPLDQPAWEGAETLLESTVALMTAGTQLGPYKIEGPLGAGGMGEVFRAIDTRLGRSVAIKTSQEQFSARFGREARAISSLNHPHICTLYDVGPNYLVMELCDGETLAARLKRGKLSIEDTLLYGAQIADALAAAHAKGIVHRDLKPGNIMLSKAGIKVLDFGLAKSQDDATLTGSRLVMGTPAYMAPEQREGKECDARTDIYSLGLVLHEMATGQRAVEPESLERLPEKFAHVIERCLVVEPENRWQTASDAKAELAWAARHSTAARSSNPVQSVSKPPVKRLGKWPALAAGIVAASLAGLAWAHFRGTPPQENRVLFQIPLSDRAGKIGFRISPDGRTLAIRSLQDGPAKIFVHPLDSLEAHAVPGSEGATYLFWSPNSKNIAFFADGQLKRVSLDGSPPQTLCAAEDARGGAWSNAGTILFSPGVFTSLFQVPETGGTPERVTIQPAANIGDRYPEFLPDGRHFFFFKAADQPEINGVYVSSLGDLRDGKPPTRLIGDNTNAVYFPGSGTNGADSMGHWLFRRGRALMVQAFDIASLRPRGGAAPIVEDLYEGFDNFNWAGFAAVPGALVYQLGAMDAERFQAIWADRSGKRSAPFLSSIGISGLALSPDGKRLAYGQRDPRAPYSDRDVWIKELASGNSVRVTYAGTYAVIWSPDSRSLLFAHRSPVLSRLFRIAADGGSQPTVLGPVAPNLVPFDWSPDGKQLLYRAGPFNNPDLMLLHFEGDQTPVAYKGTPFAENDGRFSHDGKWIAYVSNESGANEVYVQGVPITSAKIPISNGGGTQPRWSPNGRELYYRGRDGKLMAAPVKLGTAFEAGPAKPLFDLEDASYQPAPDGRFLIMLPQTTRALQSLTVVLNWKP